MKEKIKEKIKKNFEFIVLIIVGVIINLSCFFMCSITGHCANNDLPDGSLPYNVHNYHNINTFTSQEVINYILNDSDVINAIGNENFILFPRDFYYNSRYNTFSCEYYILTSPEVRTNLDSNYDYLTNGLWVYGYPITVNYTIRSDGSFYEFMFRGKSSSLSSFKALGSVSTSIVTYTGQTVTPGYPLALREDIYSPNNFLTFTNATNEIDNGEFTDLPNIDEILNNISNTWEPPSSITGHALPSAPTENSNNNDFQNRLQMFQYLADTITQNFGNLGYNLKKWFDNIQQKLTDAANSISQNIYNGFKTLMDNIKDFFGPKIDGILSKFAYIIEPLDSSSILGGLESQDFYSDFSDLKNFESEISDLFDIQEPTEYSLILHLGQIDDDFISLAGDQEIDISFLHNSSLFRSFCWVVVCSGLTFIVASGLPSMLRGDKGD